MKKTVYDFFNQEVKNDLSYNDFKDKIVIGDLNKKRTKYRKQHFVKIMSICMALCLFILSGFVLIYMPHTSYEHLYVPELKNDSDMIEKYEYIFVGKIEKIIMTKQYDRTGYPVPYTFYQVSVIENIKGNTEKTERICFYGGKKFLNRYKLFYENDEMIQTEQVYLFFTNKSVDCSFNKRVTEDDFLIIRNEQKISLLDYDITKPIESQNEINRNIINRFINVMNKVTDYNIDKPSFTNEKEMVDYYDYIFIGKIEPYDYNNKINSVVPKVICDFVPIYIFKGNDILNKKFNFYGINYWLENNDQKDQLREPDCENVYLFLVNKNQLDSTELLVLTDYQQVLLKDYIINIDFNKQNESIKETLQKYLIYIED